jgi:predicted PurR-regulated permease PerM
MAQRRRTTSAAASGAGRRLDQASVTWESLFQSLGRFEIVLLVGAILLLFVLIYTIQSVLSPFLVTAAIVFLLYPLRRYALPRNLMWLSLGLFAFWLLYTISDVLAPFVISLLLAYLLNPVVTKAAEARIRIPRWISALLLILLLVGIVFLVLFFVLPIVVAQVEGILSALSGFFDDVRRWLWSSRLAAVLERYGVKADEVQKTLSAQLAPRFEDILKNLLQGMLSVISSLSNLVTQIFYIVLVPFLTFYLLMDFPKVIHRLHMLFPKRRRDRVQAFFGKADDIFGRYLRSALLIAFLVGLATAVLFSFYGIKYALLLGVVAALLDLIPYIGLIVTLVVSGIVSLLSDAHGVDKAILAMATIGVLHLLEVTILWPWLVGRRVGLHPLLIILSLLVFSYFLGVVGLLIAVPASTLIILLVKEWEASQRGIPLSDYHSLDSEA